MKETTRRAVSCLVAFGLLSLSIDRAQAHDPSQQSFTAGMLTFYAVEEVESPTVGQVVGSPHTFVNNPATEANRNHKVKITGPANTGNINIDYMLQFDVDDTNIVGSTSVFNTLAGLNGSGLWIANPVYSASLSVSAGNHSVGAFSYIKFIPNGATATGAHGHAFSR